MHKSSSHTVFIFSCLLIVIALLISCKSRNDSGISSPKTATASVMNPPSMKKEIDTVGLDYIMGHFDPASDDRFVIIKDKYADRSGLYMRKEAYTEFLRMYDAAYKDGIQFKIRSATRNFDYQKGIWERKWTGKTKVSDGTNVHTDIKEAIDKALKILEYSSMPGTSRHHWGTDIDLNSFDNKWFESGEGLKLYTWMQEHAHKYGFCQPYTAKGPDRPYGYNEEKWHWSYTPISADLIQEAETLKDNMIRGFLGAEQAEAIGVVEKYILGINSSCKSH